MIVIGAGSASAFAAAAAEGIARQPSAADKITGAVNLPLFLLEGVAILAEVFVLLIVLLNGRRPSVVHESTELIAESDRHE